MSFESASRYTVYFDNVKQIKLGTSFYTISYPDRIFEKLNNLKSNKFNKLMLNPILDIQLNTIHRTNVIKPDTLFDNTVFFGDEQGQNIFKTRIY